MFRNISDCLDFLDIINGFYRIHYSDLDVIFEDGRVANEIAISRYRVFDIINSDISFYFTKPFGNLNIKFVKHGGHPYMSLEEVLNELPKEFTFKLLFHLDKL